MRKGLSFGVIGVAQFVAVTQFAHDLIDPGLVLRQHIGFPKS
jgi:hypothetical protein